MRPRFALSLGSAAFAGMVIAAAAQVPRGFTGSFDDPAIQYAKGPRSDAGLDLNRRLESGRLRLTFEKGSGYLRSVLDALDVPVDSQVAVYAQDSFQAALINRRNPRTIYFNDHVAVGWVRGGDIEIAAQDPRQAIEFYVLEHQETAAPRLRRETAACLRCHVSWDTLGVPGEMVQSVGPPDAAGYASGGVTDHRTPIAERWGGWFVTGDPNGMTHMGNVPVDVAESRRPVHPVVLHSLEGQFDLTGYLSPHSDIVALMVLEHQTHMMNLLSYIGWEARVHADAATIREIAHGVVDYMLFVDEARLNGPIAGSSGFSRRFASLGPKDHRGRSLRELDLRHRLMTYPCSYMIYAPVFDALPAPAKSAIYERLWEVLSGKATGAKYRRLSPADRRAIVEILRDTKKDLPAYFEQPADTPGLSRETR
ncbi:MAG: hypothetical protein ACM3SQ_20520 [Betaproteobacteria bacterium]